MMDIARIGRSLRFFPLARQERRQAQAGFTLIEMIVVIAIVGIVMAISMPAYSAWRYRSSVNSASISLLAHLKQARTMAMAENRSVSITFTPTTYTFDADTTTGGKCGLCKPQTVSLNKFSSSLIISPTTKLIFKSQGTVNNETITLAAGGFTHKITLNIIGRAYLQ